MARGPRRRSKMIRKSILPIVEIIRITEITDIMGTNSSNPLSKRREEYSIALLMQKSGARSTIPMDLIWKTARPFWIIRRCHHQL
jgi:hypothetical protein